MSGIVTTVSVAASMRAAGYFADFTVEAAGYNDAGTMLVRLCKASSAFRQPKDAKVAPKGSWKQPYLHRGWDVEAFLGEGDRDPRWLANPSRECGCGLCRACDKDFWRGDRLPRQEAKRVAIEEELAHARELDDLEAIEHDGYGTEAYATVAEQMDYEDWLLDEEFALLDEREDFYDRLEDLIYAPVSQVATEEVEDLMGSRVERDGAVLIGRGSSWMHV